MAIKTEITDTAPLWWELQNIPTELVKELRRRSNSNNIGMEFPSLNVVNNFVQDHAKYKGPLTPWVRVFSNGTGKPINGLVPHSSYLDKNYKSVNYDGFILQGGVGIGDGLGILQNKPLSDGKAIIGYQANGEPHYIDNIYRTQFSYSTKQNDRFQQNNNVSSILLPPAISSINIKQSKEMLTYATIKFKCFSLAQLEYLTPFFLSPNINLFIEFGWNLFNQQSLLNLQNTNECWDIITKSQQAYDRSLLSYGNYGLIVGIINKFSFNTKDGFEYDCITDITSRQSLYAGMRVDNSSKIVMNSTDNNIYDQRFIDLKTFFKLYLPDIDKVIRLPQTDPKSNFLNYIIDKEIQNPTKNKNDSDANAEQLDSRFIRYSLTPVQRIVPQVTNFYNNKPEDRVFTGRLEAVYHKVKNPKNNGLLNSIFYTKTSKVSGASYKQVSFADNNIDFDASDTSSEVWLQLDFVFEILNLIMSSGNTKQYWLDFSNVIISAHPNLISCDKDVLIPNPISPKVNIGTRSSKTPGIGGYLRENDVSLAEKGESANYNNAFLRQQEDINIPTNTSLIEKVKNYTLDYYNLTDEESNYFAYDAARKVFKTRGRNRDDLDVIINYLYYNKDKSHKEGSASFPCKDELIVKRKSKSGEEFSIKYKKYRYGHLKHIYISKSKLLSIIQSNEVKYYKEFINAILNVVNESVNNYWKFDIVEGEDIDGLTSLSIVDKNTINFNSLNQVYMFDVGGTNNVIKNINFDVSLTSEQSINTLFGGNNSNNLSDKLSKEINSATTTKQLVATMNALNSNSIPSLAFVDRMDIYQLKLLTEQKLTELSSKTITPGTTSGIVDQNNDIRDLQIYGPKLSNSDVLCMTVKNINLQSSTKDIDDSFVHPNNYKFLNLPSTMKSRLTEMLNDEDFRNNVKYSGVADNFQITIVFEGIFSFKNLQVFAISNLPKPYVPGNIILQVLEVEHQITLGNWETKVTALIRCIGTNLISYIPV